MFSAGSVNGIWRQKLVSASDGLGFPVTVSRAFPPRELGGGNWLQLPGYAPLKSSLSSTTRAGAAASRHAPATMKTVRTRERRSPITTHTVGWSADRATYNRYRPFLPVSRSPYPYLLRLRVSRCALGVTGTRWPLRASRYCLGFPRLFGPPRSRESRRAVQRLPVSRVSRCKSSRCSGDTARELRAPRRAGHSVRPRLRAPRDIGTTRGRPGPLRS